MNEFKYDTQLLIEGENLSEDKIHDYFLQNFQGDCLLAVGDENLIKIHFHTNEPWKVLEYCCRPGRDIRHCGGGYGPPGTGASGLMYINIGGDMALRDRSIIGIFDLDGTSLSKKTMEFLKSAEQEGGLISVTDDIPKTFLVTEEYGMERVYFTQLSGATLEKRITKTE